MICDFTKLPLSSKNLLPRLRIVKSSTYTTLTKACFVTRDTNLYGYVLGDPVNLMDSFGYSAIADTYNEIGTAVREGAKGAMSSFGEAAKDMSNLALHGDPYARTALGVAFVSEAVPVVATGFHLAYPIVTTLVLTSAPCTENVIDFTYGWFTPTGPPKGWGYLGFICRRLYSWLSISPCESM